MYTKEERHKLGLEAAKRFKFGDEVVFKFSNVQKYWGDNTKKGDAHIKCDNKSGIITNIERLWITVKFSNRIISNYKSFHVETWHALCLNKSIPKQLELFDG